MGLILNIIGIILTIFFIIFFIFVVYLIGMDVIYLDKVMEETKRNNGTCDFEWKNLRIICQYKNNVCEINGTTKFDCERNEQE